MRTTVELSAELLRAAKSRAATRGESLKDLFARAVAAELGGFTTAHSGRRIRLPLIVGTGRSQVTVTNDDIAELVAIEDREKYGIR